MVPALPGRNSNLPNKVFSNPPSTAIAQLSTNVPSSHDYGSEVRQTDVKPAPTGTAADRLGSLGGTGNGISDAFEDEKLESAEAIDAERSDHQTLGVDLADDYFEYDPDARQLPWGEAHAGDAVHNDAIRRAREKAASDCLNHRGDELPGTGKSCWNWLTELFLRLKHPTTFQAIKGIVLQGITADLLQRVVALRDYWMERREWWPGRYERSREMRPLRRGSGGLTWAVASRVCRTRADYAPEDMIDEDWFDEWLNLPHDILAERRGDRAYYRFAAYVDAKVSGADPDLLEYGLARVQSERREEIADDRGRWRKLPRYEEDIRFGFNVLTPFRDGFGAPGYPENQERFRGEHSDF